MAGNANVLVMDVDAGSLDAVTTLLQSAGYTVRAISTADELLGAAKQDADCLVVEIKNRNGHSAQSSNPNTAIHPLPIIFVEDCDDGLGNEGAESFNEAVLATVAEAVSFHKKVRERSRERIEAIDRISSLSSREREILVLVKAGLSSKSIADRLDISPRTVEIHRANIMRKVMAHNTADLIRLANLAGISD